LSEVGNVGSRFWDYGTNFGASQRELFSAFVELIGLYSRHLANCSPRSVFCQLLIVHLLIDNLLSFYLLIG